VPWARLARSLWDAFVRAGSPPEGDVLLGPDAPRADWLWPHLPPELAPRVLGHYAERAPAWPFACFGAPCWEAWLGVLAKSPGESAARWQPAVQALPLDWAKRLLGAPTLFTLDEGLAVDLLRELARRFPALLLERLESSTERDDASALGRLLAAVPDAETGRVVATLGEKLARRTATRASVDAARAWLGARVGRRSPDWRLAYALLDSLEARVARSRLASGRPPG
jgi:hypothetical protein